MKNVPAVETVIRGEHAVYAKPYLVAEWNLNRYYPVTAGNINSTFEEDYGYDVELFPIESLIDSNRPTKGIVKARVGEATIADNYRSERQSTRFYMADRDDQYKYWCSPMESDVNGMMPLFNSTNFPDTTGQDSITSVRPFIQYDRVVQSNKIVIGFENTWASPIDFTVYIQETVGGAWVNIALNPTILDNGRVELYNISTGWTSTLNVPLADTVMTGVAGIKVEVRQLGGGFDSDGNATFYRSPNGTGTGYVDVATDGSNSFCNIIEISARREEDLSPWLMGVSDTFDAGEESEITPIGTISANVATVSLSNADFKFNSLKNPDYDQLLDVNVEFRLQYVYYTDIDMVSEIDRVDQFKMYSDSTWDGQMGMEVSVSVTDASRFLQELKPRPTLYENLPVEQIVWRICDQIGFTEYDVKTVTTSVPTNIPYWWTDGEATAWELFNELAVGTQTAIFFDGNGRLQIRNQDAAYNAADIPVWDLYGTPVDGQTTYPAGVLPDVESMSQIGVQQSNKITVTYQTTDISEWNNGHPKLDVIWEPEDDSTVLRAADLRRDLQSADQFFWLTPEAAKIWPYSGIVNIEGELIRYAGKHFVYYVNGVRNVATVNDSDEYDKYNNMSGVMERSKNHFTGGLKITERGVWNSEEKVHNVEANGYWVRNVRDGVRRTDVAGFRHNKRDSTVSLRTFPKRYDGNDMLIATRGSQGDTPFYFLGTRMRFVKDGRKNQRAGIVFANSDADEAGYYIEVMATNKITPKQRGGRNEIIFYTREANGTQKQHIGKGDRAAVVEGRWFDLDVSFEVLGNGDHRIRCWFNGRLMFDKTVSGTDKTPFYGGRFGMFVRGDTHAEYEYLYGLNRTDEIPADDVSFFDIVDGGYRSAQWDREWVYRWGRTSRRKRKRTGRERQRFNRMFFDEFGPIVHEVRELEVKFEPAPVTESRLFMTNTSQVACTEYRSDPFSATFVLANTSRVNAVVNGEDTLQFAGSGDSIDQVLAVIGRVVTQQEAKEHIVENKEMIRRRGLIESEINSPWIQSEAAAKRLGEWIEAHWSLGAETYDVVIFGNPLIEVGDVVTLTHTDNGLNGEKFFVLAARTEFSQGIKTTLTLRKVV